jgi:hypothetical protein
MAKPALSIEPSYRSELERKVAEQLEEAGVEFAFEEERIPYIVPQREAKYLPDFTFAKCPIIIEPKGRFGGGAPGFRMPASDAAKERQKFILLKEQHPELDIRFVFSRAKTPIYKGSPTTYGKWATDHGFLWSEKTVPPEWIEEIKQYHRKRKKK